LLVYGTTALGTFIEKGQRAELFELTDNEVATFRVNIPESDFDSMKKIVKN
ncbi:hypothetical protein U3516DRAFT_486529, partial [Neocallimastix sp. 'constans']